MNHSTRNTVVRIALALAGAATVLTSLVEIAHADVVVEPAVVHIGTETIIVFAPVVITAPRPRCYIRPLEMNSSERLDRKAPTAVNTVRVCL